MQSNSLTPIPDKPEFDIFFIAESISLLKAEKIRQDGVIAALSEKIDHLQNNSATILKSFNDIEPKIAALQNQLEHRIAGLEVQIESEKESLKTFKQETAKAAAVAAEKIQVMIRDQPAKTSDPEIAVLKKIIESNENERKSDIAKQEARISAQMDELEASHSRQEEFESKMASSMQVSSL